MGRPRSERLDICAPLLSLEKDLRGAGKRPTEAEIAKAAGLPVHSYRGFKNGVPSKRKSPTLAHLISLARYFGVPPETFFCGNDDPLTWRRRGVRWKLSGGAAGERERALRVAALRTLCGDSPDEIADRIERLMARRSVPARRPTEADIRRMARGGLALGLVEFDLSEGRDELLDAPLATALAEALRAVLPQDVPVPEIRVVRNMAHSDFRCDPIAPFFVTYEGHALVADFLTRNPSAYTLGIAGGLHVATFARSIGARTSPFPDLPGSDKRFTLVPLTLEPFSEHRFELADALVAAMGAKAGYLLGSARLEAPTLKPFGYLIDGEVEPQAIDVAAGLRRHYSQLDVAIFGCGDKQDDGWIQHTLKDLGIDLETTPATDVCLNMLSETGEPVPLPCGKGQRKLLGVGLRDLRGLARSETKLSLLLTSGAAKGESLLPVALAGCTNAIVCDQAAARVALDAARKRRGRARAGGGRRGT